MKNLIFYDICNLKLYLINNTDIKAEINVYICPDRETHSP